MFILIIILFQYIILSTISLSILDKGILPLVKNSVGLQFYIDIENDNKTQSCLIRSWPKMCCLLDVEDIDCNIMNIYDFNRVIIRAASHESLLYVYPTVLPYDHSGHCTFVMDYQCGPKSRRKKELITVHFNTKIRKKRDYLLKSYLIGGNVDKCDSIDQDSLNKCQPVNCNFKYSGQKPYYDVQISKCMKVPACYTDLKKELPDIVYEPISNRCIDLDNSFSYADVYSLSAGVGVVTDAPVTTALQALLKSNCSTISENLFFLKDMLYGKLNIIKGMNCDFSDACNSAIISIVVCIAILSLILLIFVCCITFVWWLITIWLKKGTKCERHRRKRNARGEKSCSSIPFEYLDEFTDKNVKNRLLKEVIISELPLEFRQRLKIYDSIQRKMDRNRGRCRDGDVSCHCYWKVTDDSDTSTTSEMYNSDHDRLLNK